MKTEKWLESQIKVNHVKIPSANNELNMSAHFTFKGRPYILEEMKDSSGLKIIIRDVDTYEIVCSDSGDYSNILNVLVDVLECAYATMN